MNRLAIKSSCSRFAKSRRSRSFALNHGRTQLTEDASASFSVALAGCGASVVDLVWVLATVALAPTQMHEGDLRLHTVAFHDQARDHAHTVSIGLRSPEFGGKRTDCKPQLLYKAGCNKNFSLSCQILARTVRLGSSAASTARFKFGIRSAETDDNIASDTIRIPACRDVAIYDNVCMERMGVWQCAAACIGMPPRHALNTRRLVHLGSWRPFPHHEFATPSEAPPERDLRPQLDAIPIVMVDSVVHGFTKAK